MTNTEDDPRTLQLIPLKHSNERFGVLRTVKDTASTFDRNEENILNILGGMLSAYLFQAKQHEENLAQYEQVLELAYTDTLTGLDNRRELMRQLEQEIERTKRFSHPLTFGILDLDYFKTVNDQYGHLKGDEVLEGISDIFREESREIDTCGRFGGEEFGFILPETDLESARNLGERILDEVRSTQFKSEDETFSITASIGLAEYEDDESDSSLISRADDALYKAKRQGRDCVVTA